MSLLRFSTQIFKYSSNYTKSKYFDYQATTPLDYRVYDAMIPYLTSLYGNPHSKTHKFGWDTSKAIENARQQIADLINADSREIIFTSGATECNNTIIKGLAGFYGKERKHIITTQIEHKCILQSCKHLQKNGFTITFLPVQKNGLLDLQLLKKTIDESKQKVLCVSTIFVNNQIGVKQRIKDIGKICKERNVFFHTDAAQALGKVPINVDEYNIDLMSMSAHKVYGPKGIGAIYLRRKPRIRLTALINGGGQQRGYRSGTLAPFLAVGMGKACEIAKKQMYNDEIYLKKLYTKIIERARKIPLVFLNGDEHERFYGNINLTFPFAEGQKLVMALKNFSVSAGSACSSESFDPSYVLRAIGLSDPEAFSSLRIGIGRYVTQKDVDQFLDELQESVKNVRRLNPQWKKIQDQILNRSTAFAV